MIMVLWIARDKDGYLYIYDKKPLRKKDYFDADAYSRFNTLLLSSHFPEVTFENSPQKVELKLIKE